MVAAVPVPLPVWVVAVVVAKQLVWVRVWVVAVVQSWCRWGPRVCEFEWVVAAEEVPVAAVQVPLPVWVVAAVPFPVVVEAVPVPMSMVVVALILHLYM